MALELSYEEFMERSRRTVPNLQIDNLKELYYNGNLVEYKKIECAHQQCTACKGTGVRRDGQMCIHAISCNCTNCRTYA